MNSAQDVNDAEHALLLAALDLLAAERRGGPGYATTVNKAQGQLWLASRNLKRAVDGLEPVRKPNGWNEPTESAVAS